MFKKLASLCLLVLAGCNVQSDSPPADLQVGDCYMGNVQDGSGMLKVKVLKVKQVGQYGYLSVDTEGNEYTSNGKGQGDGQVDCFDRFDKVKK